MHFMANLNKQVAKQVNKQLYQSEGYVGTSTKGKSGHKKLLPKARIIPRIPKGETIETSEEPKKQLKAELP